MIARTLRPASSERWTVDVVAKLQEANALAHKIAYDSARTDIECYCPFTGSVESGFWYDTSRIDFFNDEAIQCWIAEAVSYLDLMGLIERDPARPAVVRIKDQPAKPTQGGAD